MLRYRKNRRLAEKRNFRSYQKTKGFRRLIEGTVRNLNLTVDEFCHNISRKQQIELIEQFCKENNKTYVVVLDSSDYLNPDGSIDQKAFDEYEQKELDDYYSDLAWDFREELVDGIDNPYAHESLFSTIAELEIPYDGRQKFFLVYDETGETWPKPPVHLK